MRYEATVIYCQLREEKNHRNFIISKNIHLVLVLVRTAINYILLVRCYLMSSAVVTAATNAYREEEAIVSCISR
jgi:hypothetical protein